MAKSLLYNRIYLPAACLLAGMVLTLVPGMPADAKTLAVSASGRVAGDITVPANGYSGEETIFLRDISGVYTTIQDAVDAAEGTDSIVILPGIYSESVHTHGKVLYIEGTDRDTCVLTSTAFDYANPPLEMARGSLKNMTIHAAAAGEPGEISKGYAMHVDYDEAADCALYAENVCFINDYHQTVGIGLRPGSVVDFYGCQFQAAGGQSALFVHDWEASPDSVEGDQLLMLRSCALVNNSDTQPTILLQSQEILPGAAQVLFTDNAVVNIDPKGQTIGMTLYPGREPLGTGYLLGGDWVLSPFSSGNTEPRMNHPDAASYLAAASGTGSAAAGSGTEARDDGAGGNAAGEADSGVYDSGHGVIVSGGMQLHAQ